MAKKKTPKKFLAEIATDPEKLGRFILDPDGVMNEAKVDKKHRPHMKNAVAHYIHEKLVKPPSQAYYVL